ncbi:hypothetical protein [Mycolicibacterium mengxianglii]|uniref:hypothetical protein n=1 Tax=Mycolicibacterium mengxianglii TaxID=2736649 RepID=UPI0018EEF19C|nr:hypothetical protein [Mycolicibacterium mengxianglii]
MAIVFGFVPWIVYWVLVGNTPFLVSALAALATAVAALAVGRYQNAPGRWLEIGAVATFLTVTIDAVAMSAQVLEQWALPVSYALILVTVVVGVVFGKPFMRELAAVGQPPHVLESEGFQRTTARMTWIWVAALGGMTVSALIPSILWRDASFRAAETPKEYVLYWVIPLALLVAAVLMTCIRPDELAAGASNVVRKTTFVAYSEAAIDELYYLATEHVNREVGPAEEAFQVKVGGSGLPLVGDESRQSWPATYKVRQRRR